MEDQHKLIINKFRVDLINEIQDPIQLLSMLQAASNTGFQHYDVIAVLQGPTTFIQMKALLDLLTIRGPNAYHIFKRGVLIQAPSIAERMSEHEKHLGIGSEDKSWMNMATKTLK